MFAVSLLGSIKNIEVQAERLIKMRTLATEETQDILTEVLLTLTDIAELLYSHRPFQLVKHAEQTESAVRHIFNEVYENETASLHHFENGAVQTASEGAGAVIRGSYLFLPLGSTEPAIKNWWTVFDVLGERLKKVVEDFEQIAQRLHASGTVEMESTICESALEMIVVLQQAIARITTTREYVEHRAEQNQNALLEAVEQQTATFTGDTDA